MIEYIIFGLLIIPTFIFIIKEMPKINTSIKTKFTKENTLDMFASAIPGLTEGILDALSGGI